MKMKQRRTILLFSLFLLLLLIVPMIVVYADQWLNHYNNSSFSLLANSKWRLTLGRPAGTLLSISVQVNKLIDIYIVDEDNMNKYWAGQSFSSYSSGTFVGISGKTFQFTLPSGTTCYLLIDNTNGFGTPTQGDISGSISVMYLDTYTPPTSPPIDWGGIGGFLVFLLVVAMIAIAAAGIHHHLKSRTSPPTPVEWVPVQQTATALVNAVATVQQQPKRFCIFCGNEVEQDATFCTQCGKQQV
jgi:predicted nucleic acid-binding Zn ribbon protein